MKTLSYNHDEIASKATNLTIVYGTYLAQSGPKPLYNPPHPSSAFNLLKAAPKSVGKVPAFEVYILTLTASHGHNNVSAIISAQPEAIDQPTFLYLAAFS